MSLTLRVSMGLVVGLLLGFAVSTSHSPWLIPIPAIVDPIGAVFVNAIRVAVIPLIVSSLIVGIAAGRDDARRAQRTRVRVYPVADADGRHVCLSRRIPPFRASQYR